MLLGGASACIQILTALAGLPVCTLDNLNVANIMLRGCQNVN